MNTDARNWIKSVVCLAAMALLVWLLPASPLDPWNLLSPKKVATMIFALALIQVMGTALARFLGARAGAILTGFLGGLISSTATTASLAKRSQGSVHRDASEETLTFLAATAAMLFEGFALLLSGTTEFHLTLSFIFLGPILTTALLIYHHSNKHEKRASIPGSTAFQFLPILKLTGFIVAILALSKVLQNLFGQGGLVALTFLISLFEIHGSIIANVQLHDSGTVSVTLLGGLLTISVLASYLSKLFLIHTIGGISLKTQTTKSTLILCLSLVASWFVFLMASSR